MWHICDTLMLVNSFSLRPLNPPLHQLPLLFFSWVTSSCLDQCNGVFMGFSVPIFSIYFLLPLLLKPYKESPLLIVETSMASSWPAETCPFLAPPPTMPLSSPAPLPRPSHSQKPPFSLLLSAVIPGWVSVFSALRRLSWILRSPSSSLRTVEYGPDLYSHTVFSRLFLKRAW